MSDHPSGRRAEMRRHRSWFLGLVLAAALLVAGAADAQLQTGNLYGSVEDAEGNALPGVTITLTGIHKQVQVTDAKGRFRFPNLGPGSYGLKAELEGFADRDYSRISINVGRNTTVIVTMSAAEDSSPATPDRTSTPGF